MDFRAGQDSSHGDNLSDTSTYDLTCASRVKEPRVEIRDSGTTRSRCVRTQHTDCGLAKAGSSVSPDRILIQIQTSASISRRKMNPLRRVWRTQRLQR